MLMNQTKAKMALSVEESICNYITITIINRVNLFLPFSFKFANFFLILILDMMFQ